MPAGMQIHHPQPARESFTGRCPPCQAFPIEGPQPPAEHREQRCGGPMPQMSEEHRSRLPEGKPADHAAYQRVDVVAELRAGSPEQTVGAWPRDGDEAEDLEELLQVHAPALRGIGVLDLTHPSKHLPVAYSQDRAAKRCRGLEGAKTVHTDVCRRISYPLRPLEGLGAVLDEEQATLLRELRYTTEMHAPAEYVRHQHDPRARRESRLKHPGPRRERPGVDVHRYGQ